MKKKIARAANCEVRAVIRFLDAKGLRPVDIFREILEIYGNVINQRNVTKWCKLFYEGREELHDQQRSGRPSIKTADLIQKVDETVREDRRITMQQLQKKFPDVSVRSLFEIVTEDLAYKKICARWVPRQLTDEHKKKRMGSAMQFLKLYHEFGDSLLDRIVTGDETWIYYYTPENRRQSQQWKHKDSPRVMKYKTCNSSLKVMATVFWDRHGLLLVDYLPKGETINEEYYIEVIWKLRRAIQNRRRGKLSKKIFLLHDNARPHSAQLTRIFIESLKWEIFDHPPYSPDLAPSDYHLFLLLKNYLAGKRFSDQEELEKTVNDWFKNLAAEEYNMGIEKLVSRMDKCLNLGGDYVEKSENV